MSLDPFALSLCANDTERGGAVQIEHLQEFLVLERTRNFSDAAKLLHISQSALSKHIAALEDELDMDLFKRLGNSLQLTEAGTIFRDGAVIVVNDHNSLLTRMRAVKSRIDVVLEIGYLPSVASFLVGPLFEWFGRNAPDVHPSILSMDVVQLKAALLDKEINYVITLDFGEMDETCSSYPIYDEEFFLAVPRTHRLADKPEITRKDLMAEAFLIPGTELPQLSRSLDNAFGMLPSYRNGTICKDVQSVLDLVSAGRGIAVVGGHNQLLHPNLTFRRFADFEKPLTMPVSLIWKTEHEKYRSIASHIAMLKAAIDSIQKTEQFRNGVSPVEPTVR